MSHNKAYTTDSKWERTGKRALSGLHGVVDSVFITIMVLLLIFAVWAKWDTQQVYTAADPVQYLQYKPSPPDMISFEELQDINPDVLGWLTVYDTEIDYPVVQDVTGNEYYLDHNPKREVETSGAVFLDYRNRKDFLDFNTIIYGHHMEGHKLFGDLDRFLDEDFFNDHEYGNLIYDNKNHGLRFVAMLKADAYDSDLYSPGIINATIREEYIDHIYESAVYVRGVDVKSLRTGGIGQRKEPIKSTDRLILLSTCSADITNGRYVLVAKLLDHPVENPFPETEHRIRSGIDTAKIVYTIGKLSLTTWILILIGLIIILIIILLYLKNRRMEKLRRQENANQPNH